MIQDPSRIGVLLIHGLTGTPTEMSRLERALKKKGFQVEVPLLAGHGSSTAELLKSRWEDWVESSRTALHTLEANCEQIYCSGMCMGALICMLLASQSEKIKGIVLMSPDAGIPAKGASLLSSLLPIGLMLPRFLQNRIYWVEKPPYGVRDQTIQDEITYSIQQSQKRESDSFGTFRTYLASFKETAELRKESFKVAPHLKAASLVLQSSEDTLMDPRNADVVFNLLGSTKKNIVYLTGCDHVMTVDLKHKEVSEFTIQFIEGTASELPPKSLA